MFPTDRGTLRQWCGLLAAVTLLAVCLLLLGSQAVTAEGGPPGGAMPAAHISGGAIDAGPQPDPGYAVDMTYHAVWGLVDAGATITVSRASDGAYGAAQADGVGFFWTPLYLSSGDPAHIAGDDSLQIYKDGVSAATIAPLTITGQIDILNDTVDGNLTGTAALPPSVTVILGDMGWMVADEPQVTATVDSNGDFAADFGAEGVDIGPNEMAQVKYNDANGNVVLRYLYPSQVFRVNGWNQVQGYADPGTQVTVTVYMTYPSDVRWQSTTWANPPHGIYQADGDVEYGDVAEVDLGGGTVLSVTANYLEMWPDAASDVVTGTAPANVRLRGYVWNSAWDLFASDVVTAAGSGSYSLTLSGLDAWTWAYVAYRDSEGDEVGYAAPPSQIRAYPQYGSLQAVAAGPHQAMTYTLDHGGTITSTTTDSGQNNGGGWWNVGELGAGDRITVELPGQTMTMTVADLSAEPDTVQDAIVGQSDTPGKLMVDAWQWHGERYPINRDIFVSASVTASVPFTATFSNFDIRDGLGGWWLRHFDANGHNTFLRGWYGQEGGGWETPHFEVELLPDAVSGIAPSAGEVVTAYLYAADGTTLVAWTDQDSDGDPWRFRLDDFGGADIQAGQWLTVTSESGWEAGLQVPTLTIEADEATDLVWGEGPKALVFVRAGDGNWIDQFVPVDDYSFHTAYFGYDLQPGDRASVTYQAPNGNRVRQNFYPPRLGIDKQNTNGYARPNGVYVYRIEYWNDSQGEAQDVQIVDTLPQSTTLAGDTSGYPRVEAGGVVTWSLGTLEPNAWGLFMVTLDLDPSLGHGSQITPGNCALITTTTPGDDDLGNNSSCAGPADVWDDEVQISVDKWPQPNDPTPGEKFEYQIQVCNERGAAAGPVRLTDTLPLSTTLVDWWMDDEWGPYWNEVSRAPGELVLEAPGYPGDECRRIQVRVELDAGAQISDTLVNEAAVHAAGDVDPGNDKVTRYTHIAAPRYDLRLQKRFDGGELVPGGSLQFGFDYENRGNLATPAWLTDTLPPSTTYQVGSAWGGDWPNFYPLEPTTVTNQYLVWDLGELAVNGRGSFWFSLEISDTVTPTTVLTNCGLIGAHQPDDAPWDNQSCVATTVYTSGAPNLWLEKEVENYEPGSGNIDYRLRFGNYGDVTADHVRLTDTVPISTSLAWYDPPWWLEPFTVTETSTQLVIEFQRLEPGQGGEVRLSVSLDDPSARLITYTNVATISRPPSETNPADNQDQVSVYSGNEINWIELQVDGTDIWGCGPSTPVTITTVSETLYINDACWGQGLSYPIRPGDRMTVEAGSGVEPVYITVPDPFTVEANANTDMVWGQIDALDQELVDVSVDNGASKEAQTNDSGYFETGTWLPRGGRGQVRYRTEIDHVDVTFHHDFQSPDLMLRVFYDGDRVGADYEAGHTVWLTVTTAAGAIKGTASLSTTVDGGWGREGFETQGSDWDLPLGQPDIIPGDWVYGLVKSDAYTTSVKVGAISGYVDSANDSITGTIAAAWLPDTVDVRCHPWGAPGGVDGKWFYDLTPNGSDVYSCAWDPGNWDVQPGQEIGVQYYEPDGDSVLHAFHEPTLNIGVNYAHDWVNGNTDNGTQVVITLYDMTGTLKATAVVTAGMSGDQHFNTSDGDFWTPSYPDIVPGDRVTATAASLGLQTWVNPVGVISGTVDDGANTVSGTIYAPFGSMTLTVECQIYIENGPSSIIVTDVVAYGGPYLCDFDDVGWDLLPGQDVGVQYYEPDNDQVINVFRVPAADVSVDKQGQGQPAPGGNYVYRINYHNYGDLDASGVVISDSLPAGVTYITDTSGLTCPRCTPGASGTLSWTVGTQGSQVDSFFDIFVEIPGTYAAGDRITNTVYITTADFDADTGNNYHEWWTEVVSNSTSLNVGKWPWTGNPAAGYEFVWEVSVCNNGETNSTQLTLSDTLPLSMTLQGWAGEVGWAQESLTSDELVLSYPSVPAWECRNVQLTFQVANNISSGVDISNTVVITAANDVTDTDNATESWVQIGDPWLNLQLDKSWGGGQLVPGGVIRYNVDYWNDGNLPVGGTIRVTDTLPVSTTLEAWSSYGPPVSLIQQGGGYVVWEFSGLKNGYGGGINLELKVDGNANPGTVLTNTARISCVSGEGDCSDNEDVWVEELYAAGAPNLRVRKYGDWNNWGDWGLEAWYNVAIENIGDQAAGPVVFTDTYDSKMYVNWLDVQYDDRGGERWWSWADNPGGHYFTATFETLDPGEAAWANFNTMTDTWPVPAALFTNTAEVQCLPDEIDWWTCGNNQDQRVLETGPDLYVEKELVAGQLLPGELMTFSLVFGNAGCSGPRETSGNVVVSDTLSANLVYSNAVERCGDDWCDRGPDNSQGQELGWWYGNFGNCEEHEIRLTVRISGTVGDGDLISDVVQIATDQPLEDAELDYKNNSAKYKGVVLLPVFTVTKSYEGEVAGTIVTYTLTVSNVGGLAGSQVVLSDTLPQGLTFGGSDGTYNAVTGDITWTFSTIPAVTGTVQGWFSATLPCTAGQLITNDRYLVVTSTLGVTTPPGVPVSLTTVSPTIGLSLSYLPLDAVAGDQVDFTAQVQSDGPEMAGYAWDFGEGGGSVPGGLAASHTYSQAGSYDVVFTATDTCGYYEVATKTVVVRAPVLSASFDQSDQEALVGQTVYFTDTSTTAIQAGQAAPINQWRWDFGDGSAPATSQHAQHAYAQVGTFTVTLTVTDAVGYSDQASGAVKVVLGCTPLTSAALAYAPAAPAIKATVVFSATFQPVSATLPITYEWAFGDGQTATGSLPTVQHSYTTTGTKTAQVTIKNACTPTGVVAQQTINVGGLRVYLPLIMKKP